MLNGSMDINIFKSKLEFSVIIPEQNLKCFERLTYKTLKTDYPLSHQEH